MFRNISAIVSLLACAAVAGTQQSPRVPPIVSAPNHVSGSTATFRNPGATYVPNNAGYSVAAPTGIYQDVVADQNANGKAPVQGQVGNNGGSCGGCGDTGCGSCGECGGYFGAGAEHWGGRLIGRNGGCDDYGCGDCGCCDRYLSVFGGWNHVLDYNGENEIVGAQLNGTFADGYALGAALGRQARCNRNLRSELEFTYRHNGGDEWTANLVGAAPVTQPWDGDVNVYSGMLNVGWDLGGRTLGRITPYVSGGLGFAFVNAELQTATTQYSVDESTFAYQAAGGLLFPMGPRADCFCEYRFFGTDDVSLQDVTNANVGYVGDFEYRSHNILFGIRFCR